MKSHARSERLFSSRCVCVGKDVSLENALVLPRRRIIQRERSNNKAKKSYINNTFAHAPRTFSRSRSDAPEKKEWSPSSFQKLQFRVFEPERPIKSDIRLPQNIQRFHVLRLSQRERETEPFIRSVASPLSSRVLFLNKNTV